MEKINSSENEYDKLVTPEAVLDQLHAWYPNLQSLFDTIKDMQFSADSSGGYHDRALVYKGNTTDYRSYEDKVRTGSMNTLNRLASAYYLALTNSKTPDDGFREGLRVQAFISAIYFGEAPFINEDTGEMTDEPVNFTKPAGNYTVKG